MVALDQMPRGWWRGLRAELGPCVEDAEQVPNDEGPVEADLAVARQNLRL
jgi:hypothetical protein